MNRDADFSRILGAKLRGLRRSARVSQLAVCERVGLTQAGLSNYELGKRCPPVDLFVRLVDASGADVDADEILHEAIIEWSMVVKERAG